MAWWHRHRTEWLLVAIFTALICVWRLVPATFKFKLQKTMQELQAPVWYATDGLHSATSYEALKSESKDKLARRIVELSRTLAAERLRRTAEEFGRTIELASPPHTMRGSIRNFSAVYARVLRRDMKAWWQELILSRGAVDDTRENCAIVCGNQLAGKTLAIFSNHTVALLITDRRFRIVAHFENDARPVVYEGISQHAFGKPIGFISHVPLDVIASKERPIKVVTSSLSGTYPDGLTIGIVTELRMSSNGVFQEGIVTLSPILSSLREVAILSRNDAAEISVAQ
jgi:rod shape-determining protein MreC